MESCHVCGNDAIGNGWVEGAKVALCGRCERYASKFELDSAHRPVARMAQKKPALAEARFVPGFGQKLKEAREKKGLSRDQLGKKLLVSEADLRAFEEERRNPLPELTKKLEYLLGVTLVFSDLEKEIQRQQQKPVFRGQELTLGDMIKFKKK